MERSNFIDIQKQVQILDNLFQEHINNVKEATNVYSQFASVAKTTFPSEVIKNAKDIDTISAKLATTLSRQARVHTALNKEIASGYTAAQRKIQLEKSQLSLQQQKDRLNAKELQRLEQLNNAYNRISELMKRATAEYNNLAARKNFGIQLTQKEEARYTQLQARIERFSGVLKKTDADIGKFNRNVGNYGSQWDGLRFQTNQLIRELPAMAYGANVFFGAIGNNLPMFVDEVKKARVEQKLAIEQGKQAPSVLSRVTGALFNWQTALVLGITYLTLHGKEVINWVKSLWGANEALDELKSRQEEFNKAQLEGRKEGVKEVENVRQYVRVMQDRSVTDERRAIALENLRSQFPFYFKQLSDEQMLNGDISKEVAQLNKDLEKREELYKKTELNNVNKQKLIELELERKSREAIVASTDARIKSALANNVSAQGIATISNEGSRAQQRLLMIQKEVDAIEKQIILNNESISQLKNETIGLEYKETKTKKDNTKANYDYIDSLASEYELMKLLYEIEIERNKKIFEDEKATYSERGKAMKEMYDNQLALIKLTRDEEIRLLDLEKAKNLEEVKNATDKNKAIFEIEQDYANKLGIIRQNYSKQETEINNEIAKSYDVVIKQQWEYLKNLNAINQLEQNRSSSNVAFLEKATFRTILKDYEDYENKKNEIAEDAQKERINLRLEEIERELSITKYGSEEYQRFQAEKIQLEKELANIQQKNAEDQAKRLQKLAQDYKKFVQGFQNDVLNILPSLQTLISDDFTDMINGLLDNGAFREAAIATAVQITEVFQDMYNLMQQNSEAYFQRQFELLEMQKDIAIKNAGESTVAREEIEKQYEQERRQLERERAKQQKEQAMFNAIINLAQGIMATIALGPTALPLIPLIAALGAIQIGMIASQPLPAYEKGTENHPGGSAIVGEKRPEVVVEPGKKPYVVNKPSILDLAKGSKVIPSLSDWNKEVNSILMSQSIIPYSGSNNSLTKEDMRELISEMSKNSSEKYEINIDKQGINATIMRGTNRVKKLNSRIRIKSNR